MNVVTSSRRLLAASSIGVMMAPRSKQVTRVLSTVTILPDSAFVDARNAPADFDPASAVVYSDFVSESEGDSLVVDIQARMKRYGSGTNTVGMV